MDSYRGSIPAWDFAAESRVGRNLFRSAMEGAQHRRTTLSQQTALGLDQPSRPHLRGHV
jgi:hypothetical protein